MSKKQQGGKSALKKVKKIFLSAIALILAIITAGVVYAFSINAYIKGYSDEYILSAEDASALKDIDCILVLGAAVWGESLSPMLEDRMLTGISLYESNASTRILVSGDHGQVDYDEVNKMKDYAVKKGVPSDNIFMDHAGFSTYESMYRARDVFKIKKVIIVTQKYHLYRAVYDARKLGLEAYGVSADLREYGSATDSYNNSREILARNKDFLWCIVKPEPTYLGDSIPISGSGSLTDDKIR